MSVVVLVTFVAFEMVPVAVPFALFAPKPIGLTLDYRG